MSAVDLFAADFPHGTERGYEMGCRSSMVCQVDQSRWFSCKDVHDKRQGPEWRTVSPNDTISKVQNGRLIVEDESGADPAPIPAAEVPEVSTGRTEPLAEVDPLLISKGPRGETRHGSNGGWKKGCRGDDCPAIKILGYSCTDAHLGKTSHDEPESRVSADVVDDAEDLLEQIEEQHLADVIGEPAPEAPAWVGELFVESPGDVPQIPDYAFMAVWEALGFDVDDFYAWSEKDGAAARWDQLLTWIREWKSSNDTMASSLTQAAQLLEERSKTVQDLTGEIGKLSERIGSEVVEAHERNREQHDTIDAQAETIKDLNDMVRQLEQRASLVPELQTVELVGGGADPFSTVVDGLNRAAAGSLRPMHMHLRIDSDGSRDLDVQWD